MRRRAIATRVAAFLVASACAGTGAARADDSATLNLRAQLESREDARGTRGNTFEQAELRWQLNAPLRNALRGVFTARHDSGDGPNAALRVNELTLERPLGAGFVTVGKKVMSWDVGYAFRPLDVVQQEDRRALNPVTLNGVPMLAWEAFDASRAVTVVLSNPGKGRGAQPRDDGSLALRLYRQNGARDEYAVLRVSARNGLEGGASFSHVATEELEMHGSLLFQQRHEEWTFSRVAPPRWQRREGGGKALAGFTWTNAGKFSVLGEAWLDRTAPRAQQRNLLLRASQNDGDLDVFADVLWQPQNGSRISSVGMSWKPGPWLFSASLRHNGGPAGTLVRNTAVATAQYAF
ncbi:hypothetical protein [Pseudoduganella namucuonensis]|uniref:Porin n=1 Tax=Pseudoduganella namucuonensis TaxID=1035707 RepID=A0A1I7LC70_9BURK|nr:hypothetical protein [Pseudoduganella namucuonensis]SFV07144.1 hypothetical protein SAMN05216552_102659 [Pseudoduganella namucuonensis]